MKALIQRTLLWSQRAIEMENSRSRALQQRPGREYQKNLHFSQILLINTIAIDHEGSEFVSVQKSNKGRNLMCFSCPYIAAMHVVPKHLPVASLLLSCVLSYINTRIYTGECFVLSMYLSFPLFLPLFTPNTFVILHCFSSPKILFLEKDNRPKRP